MQTLLKRWQMYKERLVLGIDAGTTKIKAALLDEGNHFIDVVSKDVEVLMPFDGACEMDMNVVWCIVCEAVTELYGRNQEIWEQIAMVGVCGQGDGAWMVDAEGEPVYRAILWNDTRMQGLDLDVLNRECIELDTVRLFPGAAPVILKWLKEHEREAYDKTAHVLHCSDWLNYKLTGVYATDESNASTAYMNIFTKEYAEVILDRLGVSEMKAAFPKVYHSSHVIGSVSKEAESQCFLKAGTPVIAGAIDVLAVATGCGVEDIGQKGSIVGTTLGNYVVLDEELAHRCCDDCGSVLCHTKEGTYIKLMAALSGASSLDWVKKEICADEPYAELEAKLAQIPVGSEGVFYHPYLYGERSPFRIPSASGAFFGLRAYHSKYHMARAAFEGVALSLYDCYESLPKTEGTVSIAGGAARSDFLCQMLCDCIGRPVVRQRDKELGILGLAKLLHHALGIPVAQKGNEGDQFVPNMENHVIYQGLYEMFCQLKGALKFFWLRDDNNTISR